ncbi:MAG: hypothetical protein ACRC50_02775 [Gaiella sp.]
MRHRTALALVLGLGALALLGAGCGGDDGGDSAAPADTTAEQTTDTTEATETTETAGDAVTDVDLGAIGGLSEECTELVAIGAKISQAVGTQGGDIDTSVDYFTELADAAPDEIKDDLEVFADQFAEFAKAVQGLDLSGGTTPSAEDVQKLQEASAAFDDPKLQEASANIEAWAKENCETG